MPIYNETGSGGLIIPSRPSTGVLRDIIDFYSLEEASGNRLSRTDSNFYLAPSGITAQYIPGISGDAIQLTGSTTGGEGKAVSNRTYSVDSDLTLAFWINAQIPGNGVRWTAVSIADILTLDVFDDTVGQMHYLPTYNGNTYAGLTTSSNLWILITLVLSGSNLGFYFNGAFGSANPLTLVQVQGPLSLKGCNLAANSTEIDEVGVWSRALTGPEINNLFNSGHPLAWPMGETFNVSAPTTVVSVINGEIGSGGVLVGGASYTTYNETGSSGVLLAGLASTSTDIAATGGILLNGSVAPNEFSYNTGSGGVLLAGSAFVGDSISLVGGGGVLLNGSASISQRQSVVASGGGIIGGQALIALKTLVGSGGVLVGGTSPFQYFADITWQSGVLVEGSAAAGVNFTTITATGGVLLDGTAPNGQSIVGLGGALASGDSVLQMHYYDAEAGGPLCSGVAIQNLFIYNLALNGGAETTGSAILERLKLLVKHHTNYALCLNTDNIVKHIEAAKLVKDTISAFSEPIPDTQPVYTIPHDAKYCDFDVRCIEGVLPEIVEDRQGVYIPPEIGDPDSDVDLSH